MDIKTKVTIVFGPDAKPSFFMAKSNKGTLKQRAVAPIGNPSGIRRKALRHVVQNNRYTIHPLGTIL